MDSRTRERDAHSDQEIMSILRLRNVAVVGTSRDPTKPSQYVPRYLIEHGYNVLHVTPFAQEVFGLKCYKGLLDVEKPIDIVDVFRPSRNVPAVIDAAIKKKVRVVWLQQGIHDPASEEDAIKNGINVVWNRCMMKERSRLFGEKELL